jgi:predicted nucleic acid-binding Zn ribbon protein
MICKVCGTEIADKALICYRCGTATFEPKRREQQKRRPTSLLPSVLGLVILVVAALLMARAAIGAVPRTIGFVLMVLAAIAILLQRFLRRRRR